MFRNNRYIEKIVNLSNCRLAQSGIRPPAYGVLPARSPKRFAFRYRPRRFRLKTIHRIVFLTPKPSRVRIVAGNKIYRKDSGSIKLSFGGESGIRTHGTLPYDGFQDRSVMTTSVSLRVWARIIISNYLRDVNA